MSHVENKQQNGRHKSNNSNSKWNTSIKLSLFENGIIIYIEISINQQKSTRTNKWVQQDWQDIKHTHTQTHTHTHTPITFLYINSEHLQIEI